MLKVRYCLTVLNRMWRRNTETNSNLQNRHWCHCSGHGLYASGQTIRQPAVLWRKLRSGNWLAHWRVGLGTKHYLYISHTFSMHLWFQISRCKCTYLGRLKCQSVIQTFSADQCFPICALPPHCLKSSFTFKTSYLH